DRLPVAWTIPEEPTGHSLPEPEVVQALQNDDLALSCPEHPVDVLVRDVRDPLPAGVNQIEPSPEFSLVPPHEKSVLDTQHVPVAWRLIVERQGIAMPWGRPRQRLEPHGPVCTDDAPFGPPWPPPASDWHTEASSRSAAEPRRDPA